MYRGFFALRQNTLSRWNNLNVNEMSKCLRQLLTLLNLICSLTFSAFSQPFIRSSVIEISFIAFKIHWILCLVRTKRRFHHNWVESTFPFGKRTSRTMEYSSSASRNAYQFCQFFQIFRFKPVHLMSGTTLNENNLPSLDCTMINRSSIVCSFLSLSLSFSSITFQAKYPARKSHSKTKTQTPRDLQEQLTQRPAG